MSRRWIEVIRGAMNMPLWFSNLMLWSFQIALLVLAAAFLPRLLQIRQPRALLIYWRLLLAISLLLPLVQPWHPAQTIGTITMAPDISSAIRASRPAVTHWHLPSVRVIAEIIGVVILAGIAARLVILALGLLKLRQFRRTSAPISTLSEFAAVLEEMCTLVNARAEFRLSTEVESPVTFGFLAPVILLPERFPSMDGRFQSAIACHELLHARRHDWVHHLAEEIVRAAFWFHPAIAWLIVLIRLAREQAVDLEVVTLTKARRTYLEALLEFTTHRSHIGAIPAPPFLIESQLAERVALMLKEVRMSRTRLIASWTVIACCLAMAGTAAVWSFPLKAAPRTEQNPPPNGVTQGVPRTSVPLDFGVEILTPHEGVDFKNFETHLLESVKRKWLLVMPPDAKQGAKGRVVLRLAVQKDGNLLGQSPTVELRSGKKSLDDAAMAAVRSSAPFDHLPDSFHGSNIELRIPFFYNIPPRPAQNH